jgi:putative transferase (TIGR04331 family)
LVARFLVTTALEDTWPSEDVPVLFLGEWCRLYDRKSVWEKLDAIVAPYHWDDRQKLYKDYIYLQVLYEDLLEELATQLNKLHGVNHSVRYWRILVGVWLGYFIQMLFDRWVMLQKVLLNYDISGVRLLSNRDAALVPNDMAEFYALFTSDAWNEMIYGHILNRMGGVPVERIDAPSFALNKGFYPVSSARRLKRGLAMIANQISGALCRDAEHFFISSYLGIRQDLLLQAKLGQLPKLWRKIDVPVGVFDREVRKWSLAPTQDDDGFPSLARTLIQSQIPISYVEGYRDLISLTDNLLWPKRPKSIFTSNSFDSDDVFKAWAAKKVESGTPLIIGQHGGNYGIGLWSFAEDHEIAISDCYLTWGWSEPKNAITPIGNLKGFGRKMITDKAGIALLVEMTVPRQSYHMYSTTVSAGQWLTYFEDQCRFVEALPAGLREHLLVRIYHQDYGFSQRERWQKRFSDIRLDEGEPIEALLKKTRVFIGTYNATGYLESLSLNIPTLIFWNPEHWELRKSASPFFEKLKSVGIFHETPESAARQMSEIWNDIATWWDSAEVQSVRRDFCEHYANIPEKPLDTMKKIFCSITDKEIANRDSLPNN